MSDVVTHIRRVPDLFSSPRTHEESFRSSRIELIPQPPAPFSQDGFHIAVYRPLKYAIISAEDTISGMEFDFQNHPNRVRMQFFKETTHVDRRLLMFDLQTERVFNGDIPSEDQYEATDRWHYKCVFGIYSRDTEDFFEEDFVTQSRQDGNFCDCTRAGVAKFIEMIESNNFKSWKERYS